MTAEHMSQIKNLLQLLDYPFVKKFDIQNVAKVRQAVVWLEDVKIRFWEVKARESLRKRGDWEISYCEYLSQLGCPFDWNLARTDCLFWVLTHAIHLQLEDDEESNKMEISDENEVFESWESFANELCKELKDQKLTTENPSEYFCRLKDSLSLKPNSSQTYDFPLGFDTGDDVVNQVALVLKVLHLIDFRDVQNSVNEIISLSQEYTASPKLNSSLGKVGR